jgi:hypothetical protein
MENTLLQDGLMLPNLISKTNENKTTLQRVEACAHFGVSNIKQISNNYNG